MGDTLPLIPEKGSICADVRPIIRTVFREFDYLPAVTSKLPAPVVSDHLSDLLRGENPDQWTEQYKAECEEIRACEGELKHQHAERISREPLPNIYQLCSRRARSPLPSCRVDRGLLARSDLVPTIEQNAGRDGSLWIKNILNRSSCNMVPMEVVGRWVGQQPLRLKPCTDDATLQSLSLGAVRTSEPLPLLSVPTPPPQQDYLLCLPPQLDFINFTIGHLHSQCLRLVNVSKFEIRTSIRPPKRPELDVEITGPRGLTVTSGAAVELRVNFRPKDVRPLTDILFIGVSMGRNFLVPIACYMQPPILDILIPSMTSPVQSSTPQLAGTSSPLDRCDVLDLGARLLGDVHCTRVLLNCDGDHASFFMLSEDAWLSWSLDCLTTRGSVSSGPFVLWPAWWGGGGPVRGCAWCRADSAGMHVAALRLLSSTAVSRQLHLVADSLLFRPEHLNIVAQEKDYDICGEGEPACEYYVHLGTAFPHRALSATVQLINHSPVVYSYYWSVRAWGVCSCLEDQWSTRTSLRSEESSEHLCVGAKEARDLAQNDPERYERRAENTRLVRMQPAHGHVMPRSTSTLHVQVPDVGARLGVQRAVLMLILKDIPMESFPPDYDPVIVNVEEIPSDPIPGVHRSYREVCEVVCAQMEVWWDVVPVRFVLDPPSLLLTHSRRKQSVMVDIKATQLFGCEGARVSWQSEAGVQLPELACLAPAHTCTARLHCPLPGLPNHFPETDVITMVAANDVWRSQCVITRQCATRHPALRPEGVWLGVVAPGTHMHTLFQIFNDTYQRICWWAEAFRWLGENQPSPVCAGRVPCDTCHERACSCGLLRPARGALAERALADIRYNVNAPERDGCVATLVRVRRTGADVATVPGAPATEARAALVAYRVLAPRLVLRLLPCGHDSPECAGCRLDAGALGSRRGTATLRPRRALVLGRRTCYRLRLTNITPLPTAVHFDREHDSANVLKVKFSPDEFKIRPYGEVHIQVVLEARRVCGRRLFVYRALVDSAYKPVYVLVDAAIEGVKISCEVPLGGGLQPDSFVILTRMQKEQFPGEEKTPKPSTLEEVFAEEDRKREKVKENRCRCPSQMVYVPPPPPRPAPPPLVEEQSPISILTAAPSLTRVCACAHCSKPLLPALKQPICLQFTAVPLRTVRTRTLRLRNESVVTAHWTAAVRRWPRRHSRSLDADPWARGVAAPGVALQCTPARGVLPAHADAPLAVRVYADCWGCYRDQLLIQIEDVEPIVLDVWIEAVGAPLQLAITPPDHPDLAPTMWMSSSDSERVLRATNVSRSPLTVHAYTAADYEYAQDALPFRLYLRYFDTPARTCPCVSAMELVSNGSEQSSIFEEVETGFEIHLAPDYGPQNDEYYTVAPEVATVRAGEVAEWRVSLAVPAHDERAPDVTLLLRLLPGDNKGPCWQRGEAPAQAVRLRQAARVPRLQLSRRELRVRLCALDLPYGDVLRVRKRFQALNVGSGVLELGMETAVPWCVVLEEAGGEGVLPCAARCGCGAHVATRHDSVPLRLEPQSSTEVCVEVCVSAAQEWPAPPERCHSPAYPPRTVTATPLHIFDDDHILKTVPLVLELEFPVVRVTPPLLDFRVVVDGDTRKSYFSVSHSSRSATLNLATQWIGGSEFKIWPPSLRIPPGGSANVYLQYTAIWQAAPVEGCACVMVSSGAGACAGACGDASAGGGEAARGAWCRAVVAVRAAPTRDHKFHVTRHDHTDDPRLLPPDMVRRHAATDTSE